MTSRPHLPHLPHGGYGSVSLRFTVLYGVMFLLSGAVLLAIVNLVVYGAGSVSRSAPAPGARPPSSSALADAQLQIGRLQEQLVRQQAVQSRRVLLGSLVALAVMVVVSIVLGRLVAGRVLRPLRTITAATRRISADNLHERLAVPGPADEVKDLADTIDSLLERLEGAFAAQRGFVANASHELRTPLATMRASLDVAVAKPGPLPAQTRVLADRLRTELDQVDRLLEGLLMLARAQYRVLPGQAVLSLGSIVSASLAERADGIAARNLALHVGEAGPDACVRGNGTLLRRMVDNVIDNAIGHNQDGGWIRVATFTDGSTARVVVETGGPVLDQEQVAGLVQPFRRLGADRTASGGGDGLGLTIVAAVCAAHGGTLDLRARAEGGLRVGISLPRAVRAGDGA